MGDSASSRCLLMESQQQESGMKERGMIFNAEMVRALLDGRKTQTRRPIKSDFHDIEEKGDGTPRPWREDLNRGGDIWYQCPFGKVGDRIWVRETFATDGHGNVCYRENAGNGDRPCDAIEYPDGSNFEAEKWTPSIHMPRWASRITLEITDVRVERLWEVTDVDVLAEGLSERPDCNLRSQYKSLWNSIYKNWDENPWVWVIEFKRIDSDEAKSEY